MCCLYADPSQIQIISNSTTGGPPHRHLLQQQGTGGTEGANLQIQITPTPDQARGLWPATVLCRVDIHSIIITVL